MVLGRCVGGEVRQSRALGSCSPGAAAVHAGLAAVAARAAALIWELAQMDFLTVPAARHLYEKFGFALSYQQPGT